ncbi:LysR family transcriptional regulator [Sphingobium sp. AR-3-1]|uniref:LysR family transcriptional regulator n=1 Tax=Sphingobium psychrophilum TaxID=2728834 RepID=A0A7X9WS59_9SPHN|nr:LysR family transcriptional regulator [Sphingobium psychrophilum]NML08862.1 LysR family transcriptional regulator [Sphingobium psychrophilum]
MSINRIAFYHLETLLWIARLGTFAAAAARLNTTQPAISARVRELEGHLGTALFRREGRSMALTPAGRELVRESEPLWARFQGVLMGCSDISGATGIIRIGAGEIAAASCLPGFVAQLGLDLPHVSLEVDIALTVDLIQQLASGRTDIAFAAGRIAHPMLRTAPIGSVDLLWLASPSIVRAMDAAQTPIWSLTNLSPLYRIMKEAIAASDLADCPLNLCNNVRTMIDIVLEGGGIGIFPQPMVRQHIANGCLVPVPDAPAMPPVEFQVAMRAAESDPLVLTIFDRASRLDLRANAPA